MMQDFTGWAVRYGPLASVVLALAACNPDRPEGPAPVVESDGEGAPLVVIRADPSRPHAPLFEADHLDRPLGERVSALTVDGTLSVRSVREFSLGPVAPGDPLIERVADAGAAREGWGVVRATDAGLLGQLLNTGWVSPMPDGGAVFAFALEPEVLRFDPDGNLLWRSVRRGEAQVDPPALVREGSSIRPDFTELQHGIATDGDGRLYILADAERDSVRMHVLDGHGRLLGSGWVPRGRALGVDRRGRIVVGPPTDDSAPRPHYAGPDFDLPALEGESRVRLSDFAGRIVIINVWASWCAPCRVEMPALDSLAAELASRNVVVLGLSDDDDIDAGRRFARSIGGVRYPLAAGGGELRPLFEYPGLPYTIVLDAEHRVVDEVFGYGGSLKPVRDAVTKALRADGGEAAS